MFHRHTPRETGAQEREYIKGLTAAKSLAGVNLISETLFIIKMR